MKKKTNTWTCGQCVGVNSIRRVDCRICKLARGNLAYPKSYKHTGFLVDVPLVIPDEPPSAGATSVGLKFDADKPRADLLDPDALEEVARVLAFGAKKYAAHNWRKGIQASRLLGAALRHVFALMRGEDKDPESGLHHAAHAICCLMFLFWTLQNKPDMDDRYKQPNATQEMT